jgi:TonB family protein
MPRPQEKGLDWEGLPTDGSKVLTKAAVLAFIVEFSILTVLGWESHWLSHPQPVSDNSRFIEAEVFETPKLDHLTEEKKVAAPKAAEPVISKVPGQGKKKDQPQAEEQNQTSSGPPVPPTHGPLAFFAPAPVIPEYLRDQDLNVSAVIDFFISAQGGVTPKLVGSTGNEELDALAVATAKRWQFRPAEQDHKAIDSKIRLRIVFTVH